MYALPPRTDVWVFRCDKILEELPSYDSVGYLRRFSGLQLLLFTRSGTNRYGVAKLYCSMDY